MFSPIFAFCCDFAVIYLDRAGNCGKSREKSMAKNILPECFVFDFTGLFQFFVVLEFFAVQPAPPTIPLLTH